MFSRMPRTTKPIGAAVDPAKTAAAHHAAQSAPASVPASAPRRAGGPFMPSSLRPPAATRPTPPAPKPSALDSLFQGDSSSSQDADYDVPPPDDEPPAPGSSLLTSLYGSDDDGGNSDDGFAPPPEPAAPVPVPIGGALEEITCTLQRVLYTSDDKSFLVILVKIGRDDAKCSLRNAAFEFTKGDKIVLRGRWGMFKGAKNFEAVSAVPEVPKGAMGIVGWLKSGKVKGVSTATAMKLSEAFGDDIENMIGDAEAIEAQGVPAKKAKAIADAWNTNSGQAELFSFLARMGLGDATIAKVIRRYGAAAMRVIDENPWVLSETIDGIGFETSDKVAMNAGRNRKDPMRYRAALRAGIDGATAQEGHCGLPKQMAAEAARKLLGWDTDAKEIQKQIDVICDGRLHLFDEETMLIYPVGLHVAEKKLALRIRDMASGNGNAIPLDDATWAVDAAAETLKVVLDPSQHDAAVTALHRGFSVITGGPGTGKTTTQRVIVTALKALGRDVALAAPTGRAAKRLSDVSGEPASTLHRLLKFSAEEGGFSHNENNPLDNNWAIVDEASMVGVKLGQSFFSALSQQAGATIVGDVDQLPSVDSGQVLRDLISSGVIPVTRLNVVHRQGADSGIVTAAHRINAGEYPVRDGEQLNGFHIEESDTVSDIVKRVIDLVSIELPALGFDPLKDIQVMAGMRKGDLGVGALNLAIKAALNPQRDDGRTTSLGGKVFSVGDRVMQMKNDYTKGVFNGEVGMVTEVGRTRDDDGESKPYITCDFTGFPVRYMAKDAMELDQAWACTVHKSQGCEFPVVVFVCPSAHRNMLTRKLVYTAVTRSKSECFVVGEDSALRNAVETVDKSRRFTGLRHRLATGEPLDYEPVASLPRP